MNRGFSKIASSILAVILVGVAIYFLLGNGSREVKLVDAFSGQPISNADVRIYSDNGIRCITAPCNTEGQEWIGKSNNKGIISIPSKIINVVTGITATGYKSGRDLNRNAEKLSRSSWIIELDPDSKIDNSERRVKLIDSKTQKPLVNTTFWVITNQNCRPPQCIDYSFTDTTNSMGNSYYPISSIKQVHQSWIFVSGYKIVKFPTGWVNYKAILEKGISTSSVSDIYFCDSISSSSFRSARKLEVGLGPDGPIMGYWTVSFTENEVSWHHSDVVENGTYSCSGNIIFNVKLTLSNPFNASYDAKKKILFWQGEEYIKTGAVCPTPKYVSPACPKIPTKARNLNTGEVKEFPDACLPECWVEIE